MDLIEHFLSLYSIGDREEAFQLFLKSPDTPYMQLRNEYMQSLEVSEKKGSGVNGYGFLLGFLINFSDASVFGELVDWTGILNGLHQIWKVKDNEESIFHKNKLLEHYFADFLAKIEEEETFFAALFSIVESEDTAEISFNLIRNFFQELIQGSEMDAGAIENLIARIHPDFKKTVDQLITSFLNWNYLLSKKPHFQTICSREYFIRKKPVASFAYDLKVNEPQIDAAADVFAIFLQPIQGLNYSDYFNQFPDKPLIFLIENFALFSHLLLCKGFVESCLRDNAVVYLLDHYPLDQLASQSSRWENRKVLQLLFMVDEKPVEPYLEAFKESLIACFSQNEEDFKNETAQYNWLYIVSKRLINSIVSERYGSERSIGLRLKIGLKEWYDPHKGLAPKEANLGPPPKNYFEEAIQLNLKTRKSRQLNPSNKISLVHIVPQILDRNHAPTLLLQTLCSSADLVWFDICVISTERFGYYPLSYPYQHYFSENSTIRGKQAIDALNARGISTFVPSNLLIYENHAFDIVRMVEMVNADVVIFHGPDEMNELISTLTFAPIRILFDHGTPPSLGCFDFVIFSSEDSYNIHSDNTRKMGMQCCYLPFHVNVRKTWDEKPTPRSELGLPEKAFVMTTISNHLDSRLSTPFCETLAEILRRCPNAVYAPIGIVRHPERFDRIFSNLGVSKQVFFLGNQAKPSQLARSMDLYLNEFPFGSGLAILDAMAAGCPVVSMYDVEGPQQGRYGGSYFGLDRVIQSGDRNGYVDLAVSLINNPEKYQEWSAHALKRYENFTDVEEYSKKFEKILEYLVEYKLNTKGQT